MNPFKKTFPYGKHYLDNKDIKSVIDVLKSSSLTQGPKIKEAEKYIANYVGAKYAVLVSSCTAGLHISCKTLNIKPKDKTVMSPITFVSTANASLYCGAKIVFSDIDDESINLSSEILKKTINKDSKIKCIIPVHFGGVPCDMKKINFFKRKKKN